MCIIMSAIDIQTIIIIIMFIITTIIIINYLQQYFKLEPSPCNCLSHLAMKIETNKFSLPNIAKKAELLGQKILTNAAITHNAYQYRIEELIRDHEQAEERLKRMMQQFESKAGSLGEKYRTDLLQLGLCNGFNGLDANDIEMNPVCRQSLRSQHLKSYLNSEKSLLKQLLEQKEGPKSPQKADIHDLIKKKHLQEVLENMQVCQLQKQVKYLSTHVISSSGLIYVPEDALSEAQEQNLNSKIQIYLAQVERLLDLDDVCQGTINTHCKEKSNTLAILEEQEKRLAKVFEILSAEKQAVKNLQASLDQQMEKAINAPQYHSYRPTTQKYSSKPYLTDPNWLEIDRIMDIEEHEQAVSNQTCEHQQLASSLKHLRNKLKKIQ